MKMGCWNVDSSSGKDVRLRSISRFFFIIVGISHERVRVECEARRRSFLSALRVSSLLALHLEDFLVKVNKV